MKKYLYAFYVAPILTVSSALAMVPPIVLPPGEHIENKLSNFQVFYYTLAHSSLFFLALSQLIFFSYLSSLLYRMYVSKTVVKKGVNKYATTAFALLYVLIILSWILYIGFNILTVKKV